MASCTMLSTTASRFGARAGFAAAAERAEGSSRRSVSMSWSPRRFVELTWIFLNLHKPRGSLKKRKIRSTAYASNRKRHENNCLSTISTGPADQNLGHTYRRTPGRKCERPDSGYAPERDGIGQGPKRS